MPDIGITADKVKIIVEGKDEASPAFKSAGDSVSNFGKVAMGVATTAIATLAAAIAGVGAIIKTTLPMAMEYETAVTEMKIASGGAGMSLEDLSDIALKVGMDTSLVGVNASDAALAITGLFKAGLTLNEVFGDSRGYLRDTAELGGALRASIDFAAASEYDLAGASDVAAIALNMFGQEMETAEERAEFVNFALDNTVKTADASVASVSDIVAGWQGFGPMAVAAGLGIDEVNASLAIMTGRGYSGSEAGVMLKSMFKKIIDPTDDFKEACNELGLELFDTEGRFVGMREYIRQVDEALNGVATTTVMVGGRTEEQNELLEHAQQRYKTLSQRINDHNMGLNTMSDKALAKANEELAASKGIIDELSGITGVATTTTRKLTDEQKLQYAATLAGSYGLSAFTTLVAEGVEGYDDMIEKTGVATGMQEQAAIKTETLAEKWEALKGVLETIGIQVGDPVLEFLSGIIEKISPALEVLDPFIEAWENVWTWLGNVFTLILDFGWTFKDLFTTLGGGRTIIENFFEALGMAEEDARPLGQAINNIVQGIYDFKDAVVEFITPIWDWVTANVELKDVLIALGIMALPTVIGALWGLAAAIAGVMLSAAPILLLFGAILLAVVLLRQAWEENWMGIRDKTQEVVDWLSEKLPEAWNWIKDKALEIWGKITDFWNEHGDEIMAKGQEVIDWLVEKLPEAWNWIKDTAKEIWDAISDFWEQHGDEIMTTAEETWTWIKETVEEIATYIHDKVVEILTAVQDFWAEHGDTIMTTAEDTWTWIKDEIDRLINLVKDIIEGVSGAIAWVWENHGERLKALAKEFWEWIEATIGLILNTIRNAFELWCLAKEGRWFEFGQKVREIVDRLHEWLLATWTLAWNTTKTIFALAISALIELVKGWLQDIQDRVNNIEWSKLGVNIIEGIKSGVIRKAKSLADSVVNAIKAAIAAAKGYLAGTSPSRLFEEEVGYSIAEGMALGIEKGIGDITKATEFVLSAAVVQSQETIVGGVMAIGQGTTTTSNVTNYNYTINAQYVNQDEDGLMQDIRALQLLRG